MARVVVLNGTSSSGRRLHDGHPRQLKRGDVTGTDLRFPELVRSFYGCVRELLALGHDLVIDHAVISQREAELLAAAVQSHDVLLVGLDCPAGLLAERERSRADRRPGMAAARHGRRRRRRVSSWRRSSRWPGCRTASTSSRSRRCRRAS